MVSEGTGTLKRIAVNPKVLESQFMMIREVCPLSAIGVMLSLSLEDIILDDDAATIEDLDDNSDCDSEESDDEYIDFDDEIHDPDFQDPAHNLQYSSDSDECEMDIDHNTIPQNAKNSDALSDTNTASLSSIDEMPSATASGCRPILWFHADSSFQPRMTIPVESSSLLFNLNCSATELNVSLDVVWKAQCTVSSRRGTGCPSKTSQSLLNVGDHLPVTTKTRRQYVIVTLDELVAEDYILIYLHGATERSNMPSFGWLKRCYQMIDRRLRKNLKGLYLVHPTFWLKTIVIMTRPFISSKFTRKLKFVYSLKELSNLVTLDYVCIPDKVKQFDEDLFPD
ncbi:hypothetical protein TNIN_496741 [Trichonephila inaurata madagascariensis]|uniref:CRAL-TRIO domain-containing protein n=1 Tax=Trichonephila inaurata madagascariensis TaxID=2747483 RepID=A0A8X6WVJ7_9ARAC|nr:hypothetical protein TNIN_496741 [Trichonephila inaurata madagascariensis]